MISWGQCANLVPAPAIRPPTTGFRYAIRRATLKTARGANLRRGSFRGFCNTFVITAGTPRYNSLVNIKSAVFRNFENREGSKPSEGQLAAVALMDARSIAATAQRKRNTLKVFLYFFNVFRFRCGSQRSAVRRRSRNRRKYCRSRGNTQKRSKRYRIFFKRLSRKSACV